MDLGTGTDRTARRARRRALRRGEAAERGVPSARPEVDRTDDWFDSWLRGSAAEAAGTTRALASAAPAGWVVLRDLHRPGRTRTTVEHVAVGPGGVVVVETLRWGGEVAVVDGTLRHQGYGRTPEVSAVADAAGAVTALLAPTHRLAVHAVLCLAGRDLEPVAARGGGTVVGEPQLAAHLSALPERFTPEDVALVSDYLVAELGGAASPEQLTVDDVFRPSAVWRSPDVATRPAPARGTSRPSDRVPPYVQPRNHAVAGLHDQADAAVDGPESAPATRAGTGDGMLRLGLAVLGLLTAGNFLLAWLDAAG
ncbi:NERD domain-containing protein [Cellulomonas sp. Marseille-Q8402]